MSFTEHLGELRTRLIRCLIAVLVCFCGTYAFKEQLFTFLMAPLIQALGPGQKLHQFAALDALLTYLKVSMYTGLFIASPYVFYEIWRFVAPALYEKQKPVALLFVLSATVFFIGGGAFGYKVFMPFTFKFLLGFQTPLIENTMDIRRNFDFGLQFLLIFALVFEMPMIILFFARIGIVTHTGLLRAWRYVLVGIFVVAAVITPTVDPFTQSIVALPMVALYFLSIGVAKVFGRPRLGLEDEETPSPAAGRDQSPPPPAAPAAPALPGTPAG